MGNIFFLQKRIHRSSQFQRTPEERQFGRNFLASELRLREDDRSRRAPSAQQGDLQLFFSQKVSKAMIGQPYSWWFTSTSHLWIDFFWVDPIVLPTFEVILCPTSRVADADVCLYNGHAGMPHFTLEPSSAWPWWPCDFMGDQWGYLMGYDMIIWLWLWPNYYNPTTSDMDVSGSAKHPQTGNLAGKKYSSTVGYFILIQSISQMMNIAVCQKPWYPGEHQHNW